MYHHFTEHGDIAYFAYIWLYHLNTILVVSLVIVWGSGGPEDDHQLHHCCWTGRVGEREEEKKNHCCWTGRVGEREEEK